MLPSTILFGSRGEDVRRLQSLLNDRINASLDADGIFGALTREAVISFQRECRLVQDGVVGPQTWRFLLNSGERAFRETLSPEMVLRHAESLGFEVWATPWRLWLFGIRSKSRKANAFDDTLGAIWYGASGVCHMMTWLGTTDPGAYWLLNPPRPQGTAILVEGQYLNTWAIGLHSGYEALVQVEDVSVYRDNSRNKELVLDPETIMTGRFGINIHAATRVPGATSPAVNRWSAGCQVHASERGFNGMMTLVRFQASREDVEFDKTRFSYTLMHEEDFEPQDD